MHLCLLYNFKELQTVLPLFFHVKSCTFAIIAPTTYRNASDCELCFRHEMSSQTILHILACTVDVHGSYSLGTRLICKTKFAV